MFDFALMKQWYDNPTEFDLEYYDTELEAKTASLLANAYGWVQNYLETESTVVEVVVTRMLCKALTVEHPEAILSSSILYTWGQPINQES